MEIHTPGPWLVHEWGRSYTVVEAEVRITQSPGITLAGQRVLAYNIRRKANANLIAAAPELLATLVDLIDQLEGIGIPDWHGAEGLSLEQAKAAVINAGGRVLINGRKETSDASEGTASTS